MEEGQMRELKFRVWNKRAKVYDEYFELSPKWTQNGDQIIDNKAFIIEQYTGLKDKNGKEIYEGDIVREVIDTGFEDIDGEYEYIVQWSDDFKEFTTRTTPKNKTFFHDELYELNASREVIGNIHENPERLEGKK